LNAIDGRPLPIYGDGANVRDWLHVDDHCAGLLLVLEKGRPGEKYNVGGGNERTNLEIVDRLCDALEVVRPATSNPALKSQPGEAPSYRRLKTFVLDRPGHDRRYAIDASKIRRELGWKPRHGFDGGLLATVKWYLDHRSWCDQVQAGQYDRERLGLQS
jgi:dTDP-glucose 4,6-dehydratase